MRAWALATRPPPNVAARLERLLACAILRGELPPGSQLPSVRALARRHEVTVPTIQRALAGLERTGLVTARRGSGVRVNDPASCADLSLIPLWFEALAGDPDRAADILRDFLELRRVFAAHLAVRARGELAGGGALFDALARVQAAVELEELVTADLAFTREFLRLSGQLAAQLLFNAVERLVRDAPFVAEAFYADRDAHRVVLEGIAGALLLPDADARDAIGALLEAWDQRTVARYRELAA